MKYTEKFIRDQVDESVNTALYYEFHGLARYFKVDLAEDIWPFADDAAAAVNDLIEAWTASIISAFDDMED